MGRLTFTAILICCFSLGAGSFFLLQPNQHQLRELNQNKSKFTIMVGNSFISDQDVEFEYQLLTLDLADNKELQPTPSPDALKYELSPLRDTIKTALIERQLLYHQLKQDKKFNYQNRQRWETCRKQWEKSRTELPEKLGTPDNEKRLLDSLCQHSLISQYLDEKIYTKQKPSEAEILEYYRDHRTEFRQPLQVQIRQIVLHNDRQARKIKNLVTRRNFADLARKHSITPEAKHGGRVPVFSLEKGMPPLFAVAFHMKPGQISGILKSTYGFHIILLEKRLNSRDLSIDEARPVITKKIQKQRRQKEFRQWINLALKSTDVTTIKP